MEQSDFFYTVVVPTETRVKAAYEEIKQEVRDDSTKSVRVVIEYFNENKESLGVASINVMDYDEEHSYYTLLMSDSPIFGQGKPAGQYRREDLKYVLNKIRTEMNELSFS